MNVVTAVYFYLFIYCFLERLKDVTRPPNIHEPLAVRVYFNELSDFNTDYVVASSGKHRLRKDSIAHDKKQNQNNFY